MGGFPGSVALGRGVVIAPGGPTPAACADWPVAVVDDAALASPRTLADRLHDHWLHRRPVVVELSADPDDLRAPEVCGDAPWQLDAGFEFSRERLQYLVWSNNYDCRKGDPVWWHAVRATRIGAEPGGPADVLIGSPGEPARPVWCDGGPRQPIEVVGADIVHRETIETGGLVADRVTFPSADLADDQRRAVVHGGGAARVIAPAGSGKTRVLTERLRHLLSDRGVTPATVTAVAYNTRAARELTERTRGLPAHVRTLNSLGLAIVNGTPPFASRPGRRDVIEEVEVRRILERLVQVRRQQNTDPLAPYIEALSAIRLGLVDPVEAEEAYPDASGVAQLFESYRDALAGARVLDFDEQIYGAIEVLLREPQARAVAQRVCRHLLVDEFQDLTPAHLLMLRLLAAPTYDVFGVGDDDQVIYSYAGATPEYLIGYEQYFAGAFAYALEVNYRCPPAVVAGASTLLTHNRRRIAKTIRPAPGRTGGDSALQVERVSAETSPAAVLGRVRHWHEQGAGWSDIAVLARVNSVLLPVQVSLGEAGVPNTAPLGVNVLSRTGVRAALAYLRIALDPQRVSRADVAETVRRPSRRIARNVIEMMVKRPSTSVSSLRGLAGSLTGGDAAKVDEYAEDLARLAATARRGDAAEIFRAIRKDVGLDTAMDALDASRRELDRSTHGDDLAALERLAVLHRDAATFESWLRAALARPGTADGVTVSTVHRVKGQEWRHVIVYGADGGLFPHRLSADVEEERRVFHVAITRGIDSVVVIADDGVPSPFCAQLHTPAAEGSEPVADWDGRVRDGLAPPRVVAGIGPGGRRGGAGAGDRPGSGGAGSGAAAGRGVAGGGTSTTGARAKKPPPVPALPGEIGLRVRIRGGTQADVIAIEDGGAVVSPGGTARMLVSWGSEVEVDEQTVRLARPGADPAVVSAALRGWRGRTAAADKVPAYVVLSDAHLEGIAAALPSTAADLARCPGIGPTKLDRYGDDILAVIEKVVRGE